MAENSNLSLEERVEQLRKAKIGESKGPKIQGVAHHLRERKHWAEHCSPKLISMGPIHHGHPNLQLGERHKQTWAAAYIHSTGQSPETLHTRISIFIEDLTCLFDASLFANNDEFRNYQRQGFGSVEEKICWTMFVDGCALLHVLENPHIRFEDVPRDVLLLDNQLPFLLLKLLWRNADDGDLIRTMESFLHRHVWPVADADEARLGFEYSDPAHLLDLQRSIILRNHANQIHIQDRAGTRMPVRYRSIKELKAAGVGLKKSKTRNPSDISFSHGWLYSELTLPEIVVNDTMNDLVFNLIAYERCHDFENDYGICSYYSFLDSLIDHPDDVKELKSEGILVNSLRNDEEVANFFNTIGSALGPEKEKYSHVRAQIDRHYSHKSLPTWLALAYHTYFSNPWTIIAFQAALLGLVLTFIQTWYAIHPAK